MGSALLQWGLDRATDDGLPCFLEASESVRSVVVSPTLFKTRPSPDTDLVLLRAISSRVVRCMSVEGSESSMGSRWTTRVRRMASCGYRAWRGETFAKTRSMCISEADEFKRRKTFVHLAPESGPRYRAVHAESRDGEVSAAARSPRLSDANDHH